MEIFISSNESFWIGKLYDFSIFLYLLACYDNALLPAKTGDNR